LRFCGGISFDAPARAVLVCERHFAGRDKIETAERVRRATDIFKTYDEEIRAMISLNVKEESVADDIFQNLFLSIVRTPVPQDTDRVPAYLYRIVTNDVIDETRRLSNYAEFVRDYRECGKHEATQETPESDAIEIEETHAMLRSLRNRLPYHEAEAVIQRYFYDNKAGDAAKKMEVDSKSFSQYLYRGKMKILRSQRREREKREKQGDSKNEYLQQSGKV
jgi:RNA polymerase sigma factor (sigma-70 family)